MGMQRRGQQSIFKGIKTSKKFANSRAAGIYEDEISEEQLQAKKRQEEFRFKQSKDREIGKKPKSRDIMAKEAFNGEYDDEAGMADNNLETMRRAVDGIDNVINAGDNLPEWCQEKIAVAKSMLVTVWDYMRSEKEIKEGYYSNYDNNRTGFSKPRPDMSGEGEPKGMFTVMIGGRPWKEFTSNKAFEVATTLAGKYPTKNIQVKWPNGTLNTVKEGVLDEKSVSKAQFRTMAAVAHNPKFAKKVGISPKVGKEFHKADKKQDYKKLPAKKNESVMEMDKSQTPPGRDGSNDPDAGKKEYTAKTTTH